MYLLYLFGLGLLLVFHIGVARFNQNSVSPTCLLFKNDSEDREHLILHCTEHAYIRETHITTQKLLMARHYSNATVDEIMSNTKILRQCIMDNSKTRVVTFLAIIVI